MPTYQRLPRFEDDIKGLTPEQMERFRRVVQRFLGDLKAGRPFRPGLRVKRVQGTTDIWELAWAPDGQATWQYGPEVRPGEPHIVWRRSSHDVLGDP